MIPVTTAPEAPVVLDRLSALVGGAIELQAVVSGHINTTLKVRVRGGTLGVRLATNPVGFRYEPDVIKEALALALVSAPPATDRAARHRLDQVLARPVGDHPGEPPMRRLIHYDWSRQVLPWPFLIHAWLDGEMLWHRPSLEAYRAAGRTLASVHRVGFEACYRDLYAIGREPLDWPTRFGQALAEERGLAQAWLPAAVAQRLDRLEAPPPGRPCLVHNDWSGGNLIVGARTVGAGNLGPRGTLGIIDWDNWVVDAPELDLVKMKYWTAPGADGRLTPVPALYSAFLEGYKEAAGIKPDPQRLRACAALWLLRAFNFAQARERRSELGSGAGLDLARLYPASAQYLDWLRAL